MGQTFLDTVRAQAGKDASDNGWLGGREGLRLPLLVGAFSLGGAFIGSPGVQVGLPTRGPRMTNPHTRDLTIILVPVPL